MNNPENEKLDQYRLKCDECGFIDMQEEHYKGDACPVCAKENAPVHGMCPLCDEPVAPNAVCDCMKEYYGLKEYDLYNEEWV